MSDHLAQHARHYADLARLPGWLDYARDRVARLEADESGRFVGLREAVREILRSRENGNSHNPAHGIPHA